MSFSDVLECMKQTGCDGVMIAGNNNLELNDFNQFIIVFLFTKEPNLYNPGLFCNINPISWEIAEEYIKCVEKYPTNFASIRGHLFKIFHKVFVFFSY